MFIKLIRHVIIGSILFIITAAFANISVIAAEIYTDIYPKAVTIGDIFELNILVADINDLHSISMSIRYNTDILQVVDTDGNEVTDLPVHYDDIFLGYENEIDTYINTFDI